MSDNSNRNSPARKTAINRRSFIGLTSVVAAPMLLKIPHVYAAPAAKRPADTAVTQFYNSLTERQLLTICFPFKHQLRSRVNANWNVTDPRIGDDFYSDRQRGMINEILRNITSEEGYEKLVRQMDDDNGGVESYSVAVFGEPGRGKFEWELTGRHLTLRADGDSVDKTAFGGPLIYGHGEESPSDNMYFHQTKKANEVFQALDGKQARQALLTRAPRENAVAIQGKDGSFPGIAVSQLSDDQKQLVEETLQVLLAPYRKEDVDEVMSILKTGGGVDKLHTSFYRQGDLESDQVWDIWRVEGPSFVWHFRGSPHVHAYIHISLNQQIQNETGRTRTGDVRRRG